MIFNIRKRNNIRKCFFLIGKLNKEVKYVFLGFVIFEKSYFLNGFDLKEE